LCSHHSLKTKFPPFKNPDKKKIRFHTIKIENQPCLDKLALTFLLNLLFLTSSSSKIVPEFTESEYYQHLEEIMTETS
jgi:hypothetical protein